MLESYMLALYLMVFHVYYALNYVGMYNLCKPKYIANENLWYCKASGNYLIIK